MLASDSGMALAIVMLMSAILFILATTVLMLVEYRGSRTESVTKRNQAMHIADAGINQYMYQLSQKYDFYQTHGVLGPVQMDDGALHGHTQPDAVRDAAAHFGRDAQGRLLADSQGDCHLPGLEQVHRLGRRGSVQHRCRRDVLRRHPLQRWHQQLRSRHGQGDGRPRQDMHVEHVSKAVNYPGGAWNDQPTVNFAQLTNDLATMKVTAQAAGAYYPLSGAQGYNVVLNGPQATIYKVTDVVHQAVDRDDD